MSVVRWLHNNMSVLTKHWAMLDYSSPHTEAHSPFYTSCIQWNGVMLQSFLHVHRHSVMTVIMWSWHNESLSSVHSSNSGVASPAGDWPVRPRGDWRTPGLRGVPGASFLCLAHISAAFAQSVPAEDPLLPETPHTNNWNHTFMIK